MLVDVFVSAGFAAAAPKLKVGATVAVVDAVELLAAAPKLKLGVIDGPVGF